MSSNRKIKNATQNTFNNIEFKSKLEKTMYIVLSQFGFNPQYEPIKHLLWEGFIPITPYYSKETNSQREKRGRNTARILTLKKNKFIGIRYTPDFYFKYSNIDIYIEAKGIENDVFYIKKKMFIKYLDDKFIKTGQKSMYFEVFNKKQLLQAIDIIKEYGKNSS